MTDQHLAAAAPDPAAAPALVGGRYAVRGRVQTTVLYEVLDARDRLLERDVQLLVLRDELSEQATSIGLFAATVAAAAELPHPILAGIFDAGIERRDGRGMRWAAREPVLDPPLTGLQSPEGVSISEWTGWLVDLATTLTDGLKVVHTHGVVHGALGPATVHVAPPQHTPIRVKIDGFGPQPADLADLSDLNRTQRMWQEFTASLPTPSPEQREGQAPTRRSDIYGFGLVLLDALLLAETHATPDPGDAEPVEPVLRALRTLATRATEPAPNARPYSFVTIENELRRLRDDRHRASPAPTGALGAPATPVAHTGRIPGGSGDTPTEILPPPSTLVTAPGRRTGETPGTDTLRNRLIQPLPERPHGGWRLARSVLLVVLAVAVLGVLMWAAFLRDPAPASGQTVLPAVSGTTLEEATATLTQAGLTPGGVREVSDPVVPAGLVAGTDPAAGARVSRGSVVTLLVSGGADLVAVPQVVGMTLTDAQTSLTNVGLAVGEILRRDGTQPEGTVLGSDPAYGASTARGGSVTLTVATGRVTVPEGIVGQTPQAAAVQLQALGLQVQTRRETTDAVPEGLVAASDPGPGRSVERNGIVTLIVAVAPVPEPGAPPAPPTPTTPPVRATPTPAIATPATPTPAPEPPPPTEDPDEDGSPQ